MKRYCSLRLLCLGLFLGCVVGWSPAATMALARVQECPSSSAPSETYVGVASPTTYMTSATAPPLGIVDLTLTIDSLPHFDPSLPSPRVSRRWLLT